MWSVLSRFSSSASVGFSYAFVSGDFPRAGLRPAPSMSRQQKGEHTGPRTTPPTRVLVPMQVLNQGSPKAVDAARAAQCASRRLHVRFGQCEEWLHFPSHSRWAARERLRNSSHTDSRSLCALGSQN